MRKYLWYLIFPCILFNVAVLGGETSILRGKTWISLYGPYRMGMAGEIQNVPFLGTHHTQLESPNIFIEKDFTLNSKDSLVFDVDTTYDDVIKDSIHAYGVAALTYRTVSGSLQRLSKEYKEYTDLEDAWGRFDTLDVTINPRYVDPSGKICPNNAFYSRIGKVGGQGVLNFCFENSDGIVKYFDVVSHEMGHATLDALQPRYYEVLGSAYDALHESFADLMAYFTSVNLAVSTKGTNAVVKDLESDGFCMALDFFGEGSCLRNPSTHSSENEKEPCEAHNQSNHFTNFVMQSMKQMSGGFLAEHTLDFIHAFQDALVLTVITTPEFNTLHDFGGVFTEWGMEILDRRFGLKQKDLNRVEDIFERNLDENTLGISKECSNNEA